LYYTKPKDNKNIYIIEKTKPVTKLDIDNCFVLEKEKAFIISPVETLFYKKPEYPLADTDVKVLINKQIKNPCSLCIDKINGITKNCIWAQTNSKECIFRPSEYISEGVLKELDAREFIKPNLTLSRTFSSFSYDDIDFSRIEDNRLAWKVRKNLNEYALKKEKDFCSKCLYQCTLDSYKIAKKCLFTYDDLKNLILPKITNEFGSIDEFLSRLLYTGKFGLIKIDKERASNWVVGLPCKDKYFITKAYYPYLALKVDKKIIEDTFSKGLVPPEKEKVSVMAYATLEVFDRPFKNWRGDDNFTLSCFYFSHRFVGVSPIKNGIRIHYIEVGYNHRELKSIDYTDIKYLMRNYYHFRALNKNF
jgi:hypothetical protein